MKTTIEIRSQLALLKIKLQDKYPIASLALFGSYSRNEQNSNSDIDLLVEFNGKIGSNFIVLADEIEKELGSNVDLVSKNGIKEKYFNRIKPDLIYV
ncbi:MAG: putative nucleotidyltransferase [Flavobacteriaceae bacterium]